MYSISIVANSSCSKNLKNVKILITNFIETTDINFDDVERNWKVIESEKDISHLNISPLFKIRTYPTYTRKNELAT